MQPRKSNHWSVPGICNLECPFTGQYQIYATYDVRSLVNTSYMKKKKKKKNKKKKKKKKNVHLSCAHQRPERSIYSQDKKVQLQRHKQRPGERPPLWECPSEQGHTLLTTYDNVPQSKATLCSPLMTVSIKARPHFAHHSWQWPWKRGHTFLTTHDSGPQSKAALCSLLTRMSPMTKDAPLKETRRRIKKKQKKKLWSTQV